MDRKKIENRVGQCGDIQNTFSVRLYSKKEKITYTSSCEKREHRKSEFEFAAGRTKPIKGKKPTKQQKSFSRYEKFTIFLMVLAIVVSICLFIIGLKMRT